MRHRPRSCARYFRWAALVAAAILNAAVAAAGERFVVETILVRVNDRIMTVNDFNERLELELMQSPPPPSREALEEFVRGMFEGFVEEMILLERAQEKRLNVDDEMVDSAIDSLREENDLQDDQAFEEALRSSGMTEDQLRDRYSQSMLIQRTAQSEVSPTEITEQELVQKYEEEKEDRYRVPKMVELEQMFFSVASDGSDAEEVRQRVQGLVNRVRGGNDLKAEATLAGVEVQELGAIPEGDLRSDLSSVIDDMEANEITDPMETSGGLQVIRLLARIPAGFQSFDEVKESIRREVSMDAYEQQTRGVVDRLKGEYLVEIDQEGLSQIISSLAGMM